MMFKFVILSTLAVLACGQQHQQYNNKDPRTAAIISEQRYLSGDGKFGAAYTQEDGTDFKEETDADGTRHGSYSYIDPTGQKRTVSYTAGKDGFQATGDHLPVGPTPVPQAPAAPQPRYESQPQYYQQAAAPQPQYYQQAAPQQQQQQFRAPTARLNDADYDDGQYDPRYNDPDFQGPSGRGPVAAAAPQQNYFENNYQSQQAAAPQPQPQYHQAVHQPQQPQYHQAVQQQPQYHQQAAPAHYTTTPVPHRFQPPGKLALSRTPDGFSYSFNKV